MFRETVGDYKVNAYINRSNYRALLKAMKKKDKNQYDTAQINWLERMTKRV
jgi:hypothetical protein